MKAIWAEGDINYSIGCVQVYVCVWEHEAKL